jgi:hypothetical protein
MIKEYVIAYYGKKYTKVFSNPRGWHDQYIGEGIIHEVKFDNLPRVEHIKLYKPKEEYAYARIEERYYSYE